MKTKITPVSLSSNPARKQLAHRANESAFTLSFVAIDRLRELHGALTDLHDTPDPSRTKEARARAYRDQYERATKEAQSLAIRAAQRLSDFEAAAKLAAEKKAGLHETLPHAEAMEIRAALRGMDQKARDKALQQAADRGDTKILQAVKDASPILTGGLTLPLQTLIAQIVENANPDIRATLEDVEHGTNRVQFAYEAFTKATKEMRDPLAEARADEFTEKTQAAQRVLNGSAA